MQLNSQIAKAQLEIGNTTVSTLPDLNDIKVFVIKAQEVLKNLKFEAKQGIVRNIVEKVIGTRSELQVYGYIPIISNINVFSINRKLQEAGQHEDLSNSFRSTQVPLDFKIKIPPPLRTGVDYGFLPGTNVTKKLQ